MSPVSTNTNNTPPAVFYPSLVFDLRVRFDESFTVNTSAEESQNVLNPEQPTDRPLYQASSSNIPRPLVMQGQVTEAGTQTVKPGDNLSQLLFRIPKSASVELNGYRQAAKFSADFAYVDFPFEPQLLRGIACTIYMASVPAGLFGEGMLGATSRTAQGQTYLSSVLAPTPDNEIMIGLVDECTVEHTESGDSIHIEGRDLRGILIDAAIDPQVFANLKLNQPIHLVVQQILQSSPYGQNVEVEVVPNEWGFDGTDPVRSNKGGAFAGLAGKSFSSLQLPSPAADDLLPRARKGANGKKSRSTPQGTAEKLRYWDLITKYCYLVGAIPRFVDTKLRISPTKSLYDVSKNTVRDPNAATPFKDGKVRTLTTPVQENKEDLYIRRLVFGRDITRLSFGRKYAGPTRPSVKCVSIDTSSTKRGIGKVLQATWPDQAPSQNQHDVSKAKTTKVSASGLVSTNDVLTIPVAGIKSHDVLLRIAHSIYEEIGHGEFGGAASTSNLYSFGGTAADLDMLRLLPGSPIQIVTDGAELVNRYPIVSELNALAQKSFAEQVNVVAAKVGDRNLASVYVAMARNAVNEIRGFYRVKNVRYSWGSGLKIDFDFENYVEVTANLSKSLGANLLKSAKGQTGKRGRVTPTSAQQNSRNSGGR